MRLSSGNVMYQALTESRRDEQSAITFLDIACPDWRECPDCTEPAEAKYLTDELALADPQLALAENLDWWVEQS
ncbi:hypothetical protein BH10CHL1_BH10CHL1_01650 [soil metagenome]